jgi:hypothetical protein
MGDMIPKLCAWAARMDVLIVCVREPDRRFHDWIAQTHTPGTVRTLYPDDYRYPLGTEEKSILHAHIKDGGSIVLLSPKAANDALTFAHELGHVAAYLAGCDDAKDRDRKPSRTLLRQAEKCGFDDFSRESNAELTAECVGRRMLELPLSVELHRFCDAAFSEFTRRTGWQPTKLYGATKLETWMPRSRAQ